MSNLFRSLSRRLSIRGSSPSSSSTSLPHSSSNHLIEKVTRPDELSSKHNIFEEEVYFEDINQAIDNWEIPKIPQDEEGLNASILLYLRDIRHNDFQDSLIGTVKTSLGHGPVYFNCFLNKMVSLLDVNILDSLFLNIRIHVALIYRIQYKVMNTCNSRVLIKSSDRETT
ncbi:hypothetical protein HN51_044602, partial [Arachis hypogaea]